MDTFTALRRLARLFRYSLRSRTADNSFAGEYQHLEMIVSSLAITSGYVVDIAASDGVNQSCTLGFFKKQGWSGLAVEMDPLKFSSLAFVYADFPKVKLSRSRVTPDNVVNLLLGSETPFDFTILNLDIDSYDLHVAEAIMKSRFRPKIISMEINEKIPPPIHFSVDYRESHYWQGDHFFGCSLSAASSLMKPHGYLLESLNYNNATFIFADDAQGLYEDMDVADAYNEGYRNKPDRRQMFPWNDDVEYLLACETPSAIVFLNDLFKKYQGQFTLRS